MSRIGKLPVMIPEGVKVKIEEKDVSINGPKGNINLKLPREVDVLVKENVLRVLPKSKSKKARALHGTYRALLLNSVKGVTEGWSKVLELVGTGYRAELSGEGLIIAIGYSHPVIVKVPEGIGFKAEKTQVTVSGVNKELVGQVAANIRAIRPPEPYKGKGIRYKDEIVRRKPGKAAKAQGAIGA